jgi:RES domain
MAKAPAAPPDGSEPPHPPKLLNVSFAALWRVHQARYRPAQFHPGDTGNARFSPIVRSDGRAIPTLYAASTLEGALMETVFHDIPTPPRGYILDLDQLEEQEISVSQIAPKAALKLVDLSTKGLQRLGLTRSKLIDTSVRSYPATRAWAQWFRERLPKAQGLLWTSRRDDDAKALVLFGDRIRERAFEVKVDRESLVRGRRGELLRLAEHIGIDMLVGG